MAVSADYLTFVKDQLSEFSPIEMKSMFGGIGIFKEGLMFAMISSDTLKFKVDNSNKNAFLDNGIKILSGAKKRKMPYWELPLVVLEDKKELAKWAQVSYEIACKNKK